MGGAAVARRRVLRAIVVAAVPAAVRLASEGWREVLEIVEASIASRPPALRRQLTLFLGALDVLALLRWRRRFASLDPLEARRLLAALERSPLLILRRGVWGVRTLAFMGYYGRQAAAHEIGYAAAAGGWPERSSGEGAWDTRTGAAPPEAGVSEMLRAASEDA